MRFNLRRLPIPRFVRLLATRANEWRDTIFYGLLVAAYAYNILFHKGAPIFNFVWIGCLREYIRLAAWVLGPIPSGKNVNAANFVAMTGMTVAFLIRAAGSEHVGKAVMDMAPLTLSGMAVSSAAYFSSGGLRNIFKTYRDTLFDWPRKILPPRHPGKSKEFLRHLWERIKINLGAPMPESSHSTSITETRDSQ